MIPLFDKTPQTNHRNQEPSPSRTIDIIRNGLLRNQTPSTKDINFALAVCAAELKSVQSTGVRKHKLLESAVEVIRIALDKHSRITVPLVSAHIREALQDTRRRTPLAPQLAEVFWQHQKMRFEFDRTGFECLRYLYPRCLHYKKAELLDIFDVIKKLQKNPNESAILLLMRIASDRGGPLEDVAFIKSVIVDRYHTEHRDLVDRCAQVILREFGEKVGRKSSAWEKLQDWWQVNRTTDSDELSVSSSSSGDHVRISTLRRHPLPEPYTTADEVRTILSKRNTERLKTILAGALCSDTVKRGACIRALRDNYPAFKNIMPDVLDYFIRSTRFKTPHIALLSMFLAQYPNHERLIEIANEQTFPRSLRSPPLSGITGAWKTCCARAHDLERPLDPDYLKSSTNRNSRIDAFVSNVSGNWGRNTISEYVSDFCNNGSKTGVCILPLMPGTIHLIVVEDDQHQIHATLLNSFTADSYVCRRYDTLIRNMMDAINNPNWLRENNLTSLNYLTTDIDLDEYITKRANCEKQGRSKSTIELMNQQCKGKHSAVLGLELLRFLRYGTTTYADSNELVRAFLSTQIAMSPQQRTESHKDRRVEAGVDWMLDTYGN